jgi:hypothetical protein
MASIQMRAGLVSRTCSDFLRVRATSMIFLATSSTTGSLRSRSPSRQRVLVSGGALYFYRPKNRILQETIDRHNATPRTGRSDHEPPPPPSSAKAHASLILRKICTSVRQPVDKQLNFVEAR